MVARTAEVGARTLVSGACAGQEAHGEFMMDGVVRGVVAWVDTEEGRRVQERVWREVCEAIGLHADAEADELLSAPGSVGSKEV